MQRKDQSGFVSIQVIESSSLRAFILSHGQPLIDTYLFVSYANYHARTSSAFTRILPWYANYIIPPRRRRAAHQRTEHLGVSSLDMDDVHESVIDRPSNQSPETFEHATEKRARTLLGTRETILSMLKRPEYSGAFKLQALADNFFEPLSAQLNENEYLLGTEAPSPIDFLAFAYLSLMLRPDVPQTWLADILRKRYPLLVQYTDRLSAELNVNTPERDIDILINGGDSDRPLPGNLPWTTPYPTTFDGAASLIGKTFIDWLRVLTRPDAMLSEGQSQLQKYLPTALVTTAVSIALCGYYIHMTGRWPRGEAVHFFGRKRITDFGAAGAALAALGGQLRMETTMRQQQQTNTPVQVDVVVDEQIV